MKKNLKPVIFLVSLILTAAILITAIALIKSKTTIEDFDIVATVDGYEIYAKELSERMSAEKSYVIEEFSDYEGEYDKNFWDSEINGTKPIDVLRQRAFENLVRYKVEQKIAVENGVIQKSDATYQAFLQSLEKENNERSQKVASGQPVYGVKSYNESSYFTYIYSNMQIENRSALGEEGGDLYADESTLKKWYESVKKEKYPKSDIFEFDYYYISYENAENPQEKQANAQAIIEQVKNALGAGDDKYIKENIGKMFSLKALNIDDENASDIQKTMPEFYNELPSLKEGDISSVFSENGNCFVAVCKSRKSGGYKEFEEYKTAMYSEYLAEKYEIYVENRVKNAKIIKNDNFKSVK